MSFLVSLEPFQRGGTSVFKDSELGSVFQGMRLVALIALLSRLMRKQNKKQDAFHAPQPVARHSNRRQVKVT